MFGSARTVAEMVPNVSERQYVALNYSPVSLILKHLMNVDVNDAVHSLFSQGIVAKLYTKSCSISKLMHGTTKGNDTMKTCTDPFEDGWCS